jgi:hypothetical protein
VLINQPAVLCLQVLYCVLDPFEDFGILEAAQWLALYAAIRLEYCGLDYERQWKGTLCDSADGSIKRPVSGTQISVELTRADLGVSQV